MAFTDTEKYKIIRYLGYPANTLVSTTTSYSKIICDRLTVATAAETEAKALLSRIQDLDDSLEGAVNQSGVKKIDDIEFFGSKDGSKTDELRAERKRIVDELGMTLDIPVIRKGSMGNIYL